MWCGRPLQVNQLPPAPYPYAYAPTVPRKRGKLGCVIGAIAVVLCFGLAGLIALIGSYVNNPAVSATTPPTYIKQVVAYKEGERAFTIYFILADQAGQMTTSDGQVTLEIRDDSNVLYTRTLSIVRKDFQKGTKGVGAFATDAIVYSFGRISYDTFDRQPGSLGGEVSVTFTTPGQKTFKGKDAVLFDR